MTNGFELEASKLRSASVLSRVCLVLAVITLFFTLQGTEFGGPRATATG